MKLHPPLRIAAPSLFGLLCLATGGALADAASLIVVEDRGGVSAWPYYQSLNLRPGQDQPLAPSLSAPHPSQQRFSETDMLPVRSGRCRRGRSRAGSSRPPGCGQCFWSAMTTTRANGYASAQQSWAN